MAHQIADVGHRVGRVCIAEDAARGRIHQRHLEPVVEVDDGVQRVVDQKPQLSLAFLRGALGLQTLQLCPGAIRKNLEDGHAARLVRHGLVVEHRNLTNDVPCAVEHRHAEVTHRAVVSVRGLAVIELDQPLRHVDRAPFRERDLAGRAGNRVVEAVEPLVVHAHRHGRERGAAFVECRHPRPHGAERVSQVLDQ